MSIPNEAVEAAKKVAYERYGSTPDTAYLRTVLEAAAPYTQADAWDEGRKHGARYPYGQRGLATDDNPYRSQT